MLPSIASGYPASTFLTLLGVPPITFRPWQSTSESSYWMLPSEATFGDEVLAKVNGVAYTGRNLTAFLELAGTGARATNLYTRVKGLTAGLPDPGVPVHVWVGTGTATPHTFSWTGSLDQQPIEAAVLDGDGTVTTQSSLAVTGASWARLQPIRAFPGVSHFGLIQDPVVLLQLVALLGTVEAR